MKRKFSLVLLLLAAWLGGAQPGLRGNRQPGQQYYDREEDPGSLQ